MLAKPLDQLSSTLFLQVSPPTKIEHIFLVDQERFKAMIGWSGGPKVMVGAKVFIKVELQEQGWTRVDWEC